VCWKINISSKCKFGKLINKLDQESFLSTISSIQSCIVLINRAVSNFARRELTATLLWFCFGKLEISFWLFLHSILSRIVVGKMTFWVCIVPTEYIMGLRFCIFYLTSTRKESSFLFRKLLLCQMFQGKKTDFNIYIFIFDIFFEVFEVVILLKYCQKMWLNNENSALNMLRF
jgi:hypothetical protein